MKLFFHSIYLIFFLFFLISCNTNSKETLYKEITPASLKSIDGYVGDQNCVSCHNKEFDLWKGSHHDLAMQIANDTTVLGNFDNYNTTIDGVEYLFFKVYFLKRIIHSMLKQMKLMEPKINTKLLTPLGLHLYNNI